MEYNGIKLSGSIQTPISDGVAVHSNELTDVHKSYTGIHTSFPGSTYSVNIDGVNYSYKVNKYTRTGDKATVTTVLSSKVKDFIDNVATHNGNRLLNSLNYVDTTMQEWWSASKATSDRPFYFGSIRPNTRVFSSVSETCTNYAPIFADYEVNDTYVDKTEAAYSWYHIPSESWKNDVSIKRYTEDCYKKYDSVYLCGVWSIYDMPIAFPVLCLLDAIIHYYNLDYVGATNLTKYNNLMYAVVPPKDYKSSLQSSIQRGLSLINVKEFIQDTFKILGLALCEYNGKVSVINLNNPVVTGTIDINDYSISAPYPKAIAYCDFTKIGYPKDFATIGTGNEIEVISDAVISCPVTSVNGLFNGREILIDSTASSYSISNCYSLPVYNRGDRVLGYLHAIRQFANSPTQFGIHPYQYYAEAHNSNWIEPVVSPYQLSPTDVFSLNNTYVNNTTQINNNAYRYNNLLTVYYGYKSNKYWYRECDWAYGGVRLDDLVHSKILKGNRVEATVKFTYSNPDNILGRVFKWGSIELMCVELSNFDPHTRVGTGSFYIYNN